jgi:pteridine reductase
MEIPGKVALVTGAARRVGKAIALALAREGAHVVVHYQASANAASEVAEEIEALGVGALAVRADLTQASDIASLVDQAVAHFGRIDILVNSAASFVRRPFLELSEAEWDAVLGLNLKAPFQLSQRVARVMLASQGEEPVRGKIINIADLAGLRPWREYPAHSVAKAGLIMLTRVMALALAPAIQVNAIAPGAVLLPEGTSPERQQRVVAATPLGRLGSPDDVARTVVFLIEGSDFITGETIVVDGGRLLK